MSMACLICGKEIRREVQPYRDVDVSRPRWPGSWEPRLPELNPGHPEYHERQDELDPYLAHLACLRRVIAPGVREHLVFQMPSR